MYPKEIGSNCTILSEPIVPGVHENVPPVGSTVEETVTSSPRHMLSAEIVNWIISGIGLSGGGHFYKSKRSKKFNYDSRAAVDRYLIKFLFKKFKKKILSVDKDFIEFSNVKKYKKKFGQNSCG